MADIDIAVANKNEMPAAQRFYESRGYGGAAIASSDFVVLAKESEKIVGVGRAKSMGCYGCVACRLSHDFSGRASVPGSCSSWIKKLTTGGVAACPMITWPAFTAKRGSNRL